MIRFLPLLVLTALGALGCPEPPRPTVQPQCGEGGRGCLSDEVCVEGRCERAPACEGDEDCRSSAYTCVLPAQVCRLRQGFAEECSALAPCGPAQFCALGKCRSIEERQCSNSYDCPEGQRCDAITFFCIDAAPCTLAADFPEVACIGAETCDVLTGTCFEACAGECGSDDECPAALPRCNGACRCVSCLNNDDCGPGLVCNVRAGRCQSENLCFSDLDCLSPLVCNPASALCEAPPPPCQDDFDCAIAEICNLETAKCELPGGPCDEDRFEDADTPAAAEPIEINAGEVVTEDALQLCPDDDDVYSVALNAGDVLIAQVENTVPQARATVWLLDSSGETSVAFAEAPPRGDGRVAYFAQVDEIVFLRINALVGPSPYDLTIERQSGLPCAPDFFEGGSGNNTLVQATAPGLVPDDVDASAGICPEDIDFYRVNVAFGEAVTATVSFDPAQTDLDLALLDASGSIVVQSAGSAMPERVRRRFFADGSAYVRVRGFGNQIGPYTLRLDHEPAFVCTADAAEPNDDIASATPVALGQGIAPTPRTVCTADVDLYALPLEDFERAVIRAVYDDADMEARIEILDVTLTTVLASSPPATGGAALSYDAQGNENVFARITGIGGAVGPYTLSIAKENQLDCAPDALEPNDNADNAGPLPQPSDLLTLCEPDADYFLIDGDGGRKLVVDASFRHAEADIDIALLGVDGAQVLAVADGTSDGEHLEHVLPIDGTFTLRVFSATSGAKARYQLDVQQVSP